MPDAGPGQEIGNNEKIGGGDQWEQYYISWIRSPDKKAKKSDRAKKQVIDPLSLVKTGHRRYFIDV